MSLILNIDTATEEASLSLAEEGNLIAARFNTNQKDHAAWLHVAIKELMEEAGKEMSSLKSVAVSSGPGSYTGLRVGMAAAKGLCYALQIPLITENTLYVMAYSAQQQLNSNISDADFLCPMIDARRMEVFTAVYSKNLQQKMPPAAVILDESFFNIFDSAQSFYIFGSGMNKARGLFEGPKFHFYELDYRNLYLYKISYARYCEGVFADLAYSEPFYLKEFYTTFKNTQTP